MRSHGTLKKWNDDRGFGFVVLPQTQEEIFVHVSAFPRDGALLARDDATASLTKYGRAVYFAAVQFHRDAAVH